MKKRTKPDSARQMLTSWARETNIAGLNNAARAGLYWHI